jgi:hypothetical protein
MAFPYVVTADGEETVESALLAEFSQKCGHGFSEYLVKINELDAIQVINFQILILAQLLQASLRINLVILTFTRK